MSRGNDTTGGRENGKSRKRAVVLPTHIADIPLPDDEDLHIEAVVIQLARCSGARYRRLRRPYATLLGLTAGDLDVLVRDEQRGADDDAGKGLPIVLYVPTPWPHPVGGTALLDTIVKTVETYLVVTVAARRAIALWVLFTHCFEIAERAPKLVLKSVEKRSGKTVLVRLVSYLVPRPKISSNITPAAMFRLITAHPGVTLLIDETDSFLVKNEEMRGLVNSGFDREDARITRTVPDPNGGLTAADFSSWCPQLLAGIGGLKDTNMDRAVIIEMKRKLKTEKVAKLQMRDAEPLRDIARQAARWAQDHMSEVALRIVDGVASPPKLGDRAEDAWAILFAIADAAGGPWPDYARDAAVVLAGAADVDSKGVLLLRDMRELFAEKQLKVLFSREIVRDLLAREDRSYDEFKRGAPLTQKRLASALKDYGVVTGETKQRGYEKAKGYSIDQFEDAFARYL
jgi:putative DNA primase/helicase